MNQFPPITDSSWPPPECTLPTVEQPLRMKEFDGLCAAAGLTVERINAVTARLRLRAESAIAAKAAELAVRETGCCSFFAFTLSVTRGVLYLDIEVPDAHVAVLDALTERAGLAIPAAT